MKSSLTGERWVTGEQKRAFDIAIASFLMPLAAPLGAVAIVASRVLDGPTPLVYQERIGRNGKAFLVKKIKSMQPIEPCREIHRTDSEITALGKRIRPFAIDEIPQLINILNGTMSLVGPRAYPQATIDGMEAALPTALYEEWLHAYYTSRPGGISSYNISTRSYIATESAHKKKAMMDIDDFQNASLSHDMKLIKMAAQTGFKLLAHNLSIPRVTQDSESVE